MGSVVVLKEGEVDVATTAVALTKPARKFTVCEIKKIISEPFEKGGRASGRHDLDVNACRGNVGIIEDKA